MVTAGRKIGYLSGCTEQEFATEMWVIDVNHPVPISQVNRVFFDVTSVVTITRYRDSIQYV